MSRKKPNPTQEGRKGQLGVIESFLHSSFDAAGHARSGPAKRASPPPPPAQEPLPQLASPAGAKSTRKPLPATEAEDDSSCLTVDGTTMAELAERLQALAVCEQMETERAKALERRTAAAAAIGWSSSALLLPALAKTPQPSRQLVALRDAEADEADWRMQQRSKTSFEGRVLLQRKRVGRVPAPLIVEERPLVDVWPSRGPVGHSGAAMGNAAVSKLLQPPPQIFGKIEDELRLQLQRLAVKYRDAAKEAAIGLPSTCPAEDVLLARDQWREPPPSARRSASGLGGARRADSRALVVHGAPPPPSPPPPLPEDPDSDEPDTADLLRKRHPSKAFATRKALSPEDGYRRERVCLFYSAARDLTDFFKSYRRLFLWIFSEFQLFEDYCHRHVYSPEMRAAFAKEVEEKVLRATAAERCAMVATIAEQQQANTAMATKLKALEATATRAKAAEQSFVEQIAARDAELAEAAEGRAALLGRITRLEKELWRQRDALEGPENQIAALEALVRSLEDRLAMCFKAKAEVEADKAALKVRVERLEEVIKEKKTAAYEMVPKTEVLQLRRQHVEALELIAVLETTGNKRKATIAALEQELLDRQGDRPTTPRPPWHLCDEFFPRAASTGQRVHLAIKEYRFMLAKNETLVRQYAELRALIASQDRGEKVLPVETEIDLQKDAITSQMLWRFFPKLGFGSAVPSFLKGSGRAENLKFNRSQVRQVCRVFFQDVGYAVFGDALGSKRHGQALPSATSGGGLSGKKANLVSIEAVLGKLVTKLTPPGASAHDFLYSLWYGMQWFAFDRFVNIVRKYIAASMDEGVLLAMHREAIGVRNALYSKAEALAQQAAADHPDDAPAPYADSQLPKIVAVESIADHFSCKAEEDIKRLVAAVNRDTQGPDVQLTTLFKFNAKERCFSNFMEELFTQHLATREALIQVAIDAVFDASIETDGKLAPTVFAQALWKTDPNIPAVYMDGLVADVFEVPLEELMPAVDTKSPLRRPGIDGNRLYVRSDVTVSDEISVIARLQRRVMVPYSAVYEKD